MTYKFKFKRKFFYKTYKKVIGHNYSQEIDKMDVFFEDKIISIPKWNECYLVLGNDFLLKEKADIKKETGL